MPPPCVLLSDRRRLLLLLPLVVVSALGAGSSSSTASAVSAAGSPAGARVLACFWGLDRATDITYPGFRSFVLDALGADLCAAVSSSHADGSAAWRADARYLDVYEEPGSYDSLISDRARALAKDSDYSSIRDDNFLFPGGIQVMYSKARVAQQACRAARRASRATEKEEGRFLPNSRAFGA